MGTLCKGDRCKETAVAESSVANAGYRGRDKYAGNIGRCIGVTERIVSNGCDCIIDIIFFNGVRNIDDAIRGVVVVVGNRGGVIRIECVRQALVVFVVRIEGAGSNMADACSSPSASAETGSRVKNRATARMALKSRSRGVRMV